MGANGIGQGYRCSAIGQCIRVLARALAAKIGRGPRIGDLVQFAAMALAGRGLVKGFLAAHIEGLGCVFQTDLVTGDFQIDLVGRCFVRILITIGFADRDQQRIVLDLGLNIGVEFKARHLQKLDRLLQLRR